MPEMDFTPFFQHALRPPAHPGLPDVERRPVPRRQGFTQTGRVSSSLSLSAAGRSRLAACPASQCLALLAKRVLAGLAWLARCEWRRGGAALLLVLVGLRLFLFLVASHLTLRHGILRLVAASI